MSVTRRAFCLGLAAATAGCKSSAGEEGGGALSSVFRLFARLLGGGGGEAAGAAAAKAVAANDHRPCPDVARRIDEDKRTFPKREDDIVLFDRRLETLERDYAAARLGDPNAAPPDALVEARVRQQYRIGWYEKDLKTHRADVASFNARCTAGAEAMNPRESHVPTLTFVDPEAG